MTRRIGWCVVAAIVFFLTRPALAEFKTLAARLPAETDAVVAVNAERILASPRAVKEKWAQPNLADWASQPVMVVPGATRVLAAIGMGANELDPAWVVCLTELDKVPAIDALVDGEGGYVDRLWDKDAVHSPVNAYFVPLDARVLASVTPADRRATVRWLRGPASGTKPGIHSPYIAGVVGSLNDKTGLVMALDLEGAVAVPVIRQHLDEVDLAELKGQDLGGIAHALGSAAGITLNVDVNEKIEGTAVVRFGKSAAALGPVAKPLVGEILRRHGLWLDDLSEWKYSVNGTELKMQGELSSASLRKLFWLIQSPMPAAATTAATRDGQPPRPTSNGGKPADPAQASLKYYKAVTTTLDGFKPGTSPGETAGWLRRAAKRIDHLPILGVDPVLVEWGSGVSVRLKGLAVDAHSTQTHIKSRVAGVRSTDYGTDGGYTRTSDAASAERRRQSESIAQQSRQAALENKAQAQQQATKTLDEIAASRGKVRAEMVAKYNVEF